VAKREANATVDKVLQFDHMGTASLQYIKESLRTLSKYVMEMHGAMDNGHLSVKGFSSDQLQHLPTHGTLTEVLENRASQVAELTGSYPKQRLNVLDRTSLNALARIRYFQKMRKHQAKLEDIYHSAVDLGKEYIPKGFGYLKDGLRFLRKIRGKRITVDEDSYDWCGEHGCYSLDDYTFGASYDSVYGFSSTTLRKKGMGYIDAETAQAIVAFQEGVENGDIVIEADSLNYDDEDIFQGQIRAAKEGYDYFTGKEISEKEAKEIILTARIGATISAFNPIMGIRRGHKNISVRRANGGNVNNKTSNVFSSQGRVTVDKIKSNPSAFKGKSTDDIAQMLRDNGYDVTIRDSSRSSSGAKIIQVNNHGNDKNITQVQVSPGGGRHGNNPYVKISTSDEGIIKVVDGSLNNYLTDGAEKATIIFTGGN
jgi:filamentous hemagglutinin